VKKHHHINIKTEPLHSIHPRQGITGSILEKHFHGNDSKETSSKNVKQPVNKIEVIGSILKNIYILCVNFESPVNENIYENILNIISLTGGRQLEVSNNRITAGYGASGRGTPSQDAALSALNILNLLKIKDDKKVNMPGISICHGELIVDPDETIKISGKYENILSNCITLATKLPLGKIRVDETTKSAIKNNFIVREIKDGKNTIPFIELQGINTNEISNKKLINRIDALKKIGKLLADVNDGNGRVLTICGLPGVGKTRIAIEVKRRLTTGGHTVNWFQADLKGPLSNRPYSGLVEIFRSIFNIPVYADTDLIKEKILAQKKIKLPTHEFNNLVELIKNGTIVNNKEDNQGDSIKNTLIRSVKELASSSLSIFFFDNFKLIDNQSLEALHRLSQFITVLPVVLAFSIRKGYIHGFESSPQLVEIELNPLTENEIKELGTAYTDNNNNSRLNNDLYKVSMGIPACAINYIEATINSGLHYVKSENVYDNSINPVNKPSIQQQELIFSEFFTLPPEKQIILQYASVLGINFSIELLTALLEFPFEEIEAAIKVMTSFLWFSKKGNNYKFSTPFIQQTIYLTIPNDEQLLMHKNSALAIEEKFKDRKDEFAEELAYHYHNLKAYSEAIESLELAAVYNSAKGDFFKAAKCIIRAINISLKNRQNESEKIIQLLEESISFAIHTQFLKTIEEIAIQIDKLPNININPELFIRFNIAKAHIYLHTGQFTQAEELLKLAEKNAGIISNNSLLSAIHQIHGQLYFEKGDIQKSISSLMLSIGTVDSSEHSMMAHKKSLLSLGRTVFGEPKNVNKIREELSKYISSNVGEDGAAAFYLQRTLYHALRLDKNYSEAISVCISAIENAEKFSLKNDLAVYQMELADILLESGELNKAYEALEKSSEFATLASHKTMIERNNINSYYIDTIKFGSQKSKNQLIKMTNSSENGWVTIKACYLCGLIYKKDNKTGKSKKMFKKAKELSAKYGLNLYISTIDRQLKNIN
ncbi:MAG: AAA family ATPase, partial [Deltaproteobacteria bacterium]|nr:AAA family ATPase [Deltaproteobacteria bacterium]